jgi:hypothetical protein
MTADRAAEIVAAAAIPGYDPADPLAPIKVAVKDAPDKDLIPGRVAEAVQAMAAFGMDAATTVTVRAYVKREKLLGVAAFDSLIEEAKRARKRARQTIYPPSPPSAEDAHLHTPPVWASDQDILARMVDKLRVCSGLIGENRNAKLIYLAITSRLLDKQVSIVIKGLSSSGKSYTIECVAQLFPPEAIYTMTAMSEHALIYLDEDLSHRTLILYEAAALREGREKAEDNQTAYIVRSLLSEGQIEYPTVIRDDDGTLRTVKLVKPGPTNLVTSTTSISLHPENETRMFSLPSNDSQQQTSRVLVMSSDDDEPRPDPDFSEWHAYQRWLAGANRRVAIPFARCVAAQIPPVAVRLRRDWNAVRSLIRTHAVMHQLNRQADEHGRVMASLDDYDAARSLAADLVAEGIGATVPASVRQTVELAQRILAEQAEAEQARAAERLGEGDSGPQGVTVAMVARELHIERSSATRRLATAREKGYLVNLAEGKSGRAGRYVLGEPLPEGVQVLPPREEVCTGPCTHLPDDDAAGQECDCTGVCGCAGTADPGEGGRNIAPAPDTSLVPDPSAADAHLHTHTEKAREEHRSSPQALQQDGGTAADAVVAVMSGDESGPTQDGGSNVFALLHDRLGAVPIDGQPPADDDGKPAPEAPAHLTPPEPSAASAHPHTCAECGEPCARSLAGPGLCDTCRVRQRTAQRSARRASGDESTCQRCGGVLVIDPDAQALACTHCPERYPLATPENRVPDAGASADVLCIGGCGHRPRNGCRTCWEHAHLEMTA